MRDRREKIDLYCFLSFTMKILPIRFLSLKIFDIKKSVFQMRNETHTLSI